MFEPSLGPIGILNEASFSRGPRVDIMSFCGAEKITCGHADDKLYQHGNIYPNVSLDA